MLALIKRYKEKIRHYDSITGMSKIARRYFVMNSFDGALTTFGLLLGSFAAGVTDPVLVLKVGVGTAIAVGFSGLAGALFTERAERKSEIRSMEKVLHRSLEHSDYKKAYDFASMVAAVVDGVTPFFTSVILLLPFVLFPIAEAYYYSFGLAMLFFFGLGAFLGRVSREHIMLAGFKFLSAGILCMLVILAIESMLSA